MKARRGMLLAGMALAGLALAREPEGFNYSAFLETVRVPDGFVLELAAGEPTLRFPMFACFDDHGRLYVTESSGNDLYAGLRHLTRDCRVLRLEDTDADGRFDAATVFQDQVTFPMGIAWRAGRLYLADPPELVALTDTDGDGRADRREVILRGFGHTDNGSLHGLAFGPDGLLYFTMGEPDGWKLPRGDGSFLEGVAGALFRCRPDGSRPEVISRGFVNLVEIEFLPGGEFIGTDNWYQKPAGGLRDALVDCAPGGLYPYAPDRGTPLPRTGVILPPVTLLPAVAHSGIARPRGAGLPVSWRTSVFTAQHNSRKIVRHELRADRSTFASANADFIESEAPDFHPSDVLEDADGSLLIVDTGGWYVEHCPTGRIRDSRAPGGLYRVRWIQAPKTPDPRGLSMRWNAMTPGALAVCLSDPRFAVADRAADELLRRREMGPLIEALARPGDSAVRLRALHALGQLPGPEASAALRARLDDPDPTIVTASARVLALREDRAAGDRLAALLDTTNAPVRRAAAEALAGCGARSHAPRLVTALTHAGDDFETHACVAALLALADEPFARGLLDHVSPRVRRAAVHLLDQPPFGTLRFADLVRPLGDDDPALRADALRLLELHPDWAREALPWLREQLTGHASSPASSSALAALVTAFQTDPAVRALITELLDPDSPTPDTARAFMLGLLGSLTMERPEPEWLRSVPAALINPALRAPALSVAAAHPRPEWAPVLAALAGDPALPVPQRLLAARATSREPVLSDGVFELALASLDAAADALARLTATDLLSRARMTAGQLGRLLDRLERGAAVAPDVLVPAMARSASGDSHTALAAFFAARLNAGWSPAESTLREVLALFPPGAPVRSSLRELWERNNAGARRRLQEFIPLLQGGNVERGREWFTAATCAGCHRVGEHGGVVGPDLTRIGAIRSGVDLLESILYPGSSFSQGYEPYRLTRRDGEELTGTLVARDTEGVSLRDGTGVVRRVPSAEIVSLDRQQLSAMPEGLEALLTREQFRDLLAYLQHLR